ncbi:MAG: transposase [Bacteroidales bacterium]
MDKFRNKYRIPSARLQNWDYGWNGAYFITICTKNRNHFFGEIVNGNMVLSEIGRLTNDLLLEIPQRYPYSILDEFIVMPNHVHVIVIINKINDGRGDGGVWGNRSGFGFGSRSRFRSRFRIRFRIRFRRDAINRVSTTIHSMEIDVQI